MDIDHYDSAFVDDEGASDFAAVELVRIGSPIVAIKLGTYPIPHAPPVTIAVLPCRSGILSGDWKTGK